MAHLSTAIQKSFESEPLHVKIEVDGKPDEFETHEVLLFNKGQIDVIDEHIGLDVKIDENLLDLYEVRSRNFGDMLQGIFNRMSKKFEKALYIRHWLVEEYVRIETDSIVAYQADGEYHR